jgi:hypothetical protein
LMATSRVMSDPTVPMMRAGSRPKIFIVPA